MTGEKKNYLYDEWDDDESEGIRLMSLKDAEKLVIKKALIHIPLKIEPKQQKF